MFKNISVFRLAREWNPNADQLEEQAQASAFTPCGPTQLASAGFIPPRGHKNGRLVETVGGQLVMSLCMQTRILPAAVVKKRLEEVIEHLKQSQGRNPGKKEIRRIKEEVILELLPKTFTKEEVLRVWIDRKNRFVVIDATSKSKTDVAMTLLVKSFADFSVSLVHTETSPGAAMGHWLLDDCQAPGQFIVQREVELKSADESRAAVKYTRHKLDLDEVRGHIQEGKQPTQLAMAWGDNVGFVLTSELSLKKITFLETPLMKKPSDGEDPFDANVAIVTGELARLLPELLEALGGEVVAEEEAETGGNAKAEATEQEEAFA